MCFSFQILPLQNPLPRLVKITLAMAFSWIPVFYRVYDQHHHQHRSVDINSGCESAEESRPSPSLVPVPVHVMAGATKERLPVMEYNSLLKRLGGRGGGRGDRYHGEEDSLCAVCLRGINGSDEIRELSNCSHVFHRECIDGWVDQGQVTCPLCRSSLLILPHQNGKSNEDCTAGDAWRRERMVYLFGEDSFCFQ